MRIEVARLGEYFIPNERLREALLSGNPSGLRDLEEILRRGTMVELHCPFCGNLHLSELRFLFPFSPCPRCSSRLTDPNRERFAREEPEETVGEVSFTVLVPVIHGHRLSSLCLAALAKSLGWGCELVVALSGKKASSRSQMEYIACKLLENPHGTSLPAILNQALLEGRGEYLAVVREDVLVRPDWLPPLLAALKEDPEAAVASSLVLDARGEVYHAGYKLRRASEDDAQLVPLRGGEKAASFRGTERVPALALHCALLRRDLALEIGSFDEEGYPYPGTYADVDWTLMACLAGYHSLVIGASRVLHLDPEPGREDRSWDEASKRNLRLLLKRWASAEAEPLRAILEEAFP